VARLSGQEAQVLFYLIAQRDICCWHLALFGLLSCVEDFDGKKIKVRELKILEEYF
jgi:hypothetical protein